MAVLRTLSQAKAWLDEQGKSVQEFAREHDLCPSTTYQVLSGHKKGKRGKSHAAAVCLGIKAGTREETEKTRKGVSAVGSTVG